MLFSRLLSSGLCEIVVKRANDLIKPFPVIGYGFKNDSIAMTTDTNLRIIDSEFLRQAHSL